jgi:hypothetical protein
MYGPTFDDLRRTLPDIGDGLQAQIQDLYFHPSAGAAEHLAANLARAQRICLQLAEVIRREGSGDGT